LEPALAARKEGMKADEEASRPEVFPGYDYRFLLDRTVMFGRPASELATDAKLGLQDHYMLMASAFNDWF
jgi:hypothetical protein